MKYQFHCCFGGDQENIYYVIGMPRRHEHSFATQILMQYSHSPTHLNNTNSWLFSTSTGVTGHDFSQLTVNLTVKWIMSIHFNCLKILFNSFRPFLLRDVNFYFNAVDTCNYVMMEWIELDWPMTWPHLSRPTISIGVKITIKLISKMIKEISLEISYSI